MLKEGVCDLRLLGLCIVLASSLYANIVRCVNLDDYQGWIDQEGLGYVQNVLVNELTPVVENNCLSEAGMGAKSTCRGRWVNTCSGESGAINGYLKIEMSCDFCQGAKLKNELDMFVEQCKAICRNTNRFCIGDESGWGGAIVLMPGQTNDCGSPLPNCSVSSSSETIESSSSEEFSSSSENIESSSSEAPPVSSSSEEDVESSSSEKKIDSSSSEDDEILSSSSSLNGPYGYLEDLEPCPNTDYMTIDGIHGDVLFESNVFLESKKLKLPRYTLKPGFFGDMMVEIYCFQDEGRDSLKVMTNIPYVYYTHSPYAYCSGYFRSEDDYIVNIQSFYVCKGVAYREPYSRNVVQDVQGCRMLKRREGLGFGIEITRDMAINNVDFQISDTGLEEYADFFPSNISLQQLINDYKIVERFDECKERVRRNYGYRLSSSSYRRSSSSSEEESSSSQTESSSSEKEDIASSSSIQINLSSSKIIKVSSSSMDEESSSSALVETSSSSRQAVSSSSDFVYSSSDDGVFVAGGDREYTPDQIFKDGLDNMEDGKCYSLNPARGTQRGWINTNAQDSWWWRKVDCETGDKVDNNRVGSCPGFPLDNVPSNPKNACFAYNGTCYKCNPARGSKCSNSWLWQGSFTSSNVGWWYEEVDCYDPFGEEDDNPVCLDGSILYKKSSNSKDWYFDDKLEEYQKVLTTYLYLDALGRSVKNDDVFRVKRAVYVKSRLNRDARIVSTKGSMFNALLKTVSGHVSAMTSAAFSYSTECSNEEYVPLNITIILSTPEDGIEVYLEGNDENLKNHEQKHKNIYMEYGNDSWTISTTISRRMTKKSVCEKIKNDYWASVESRFRTMLNLQNAWDDEDKNNVSHERIDVNREIERLKKQWQSSKCE